MPRSSKKSLVLQHTLLARWDLSVFAPSLCLTESSLNTGTVKLRHYAAGARVAATVTKARSCSSSCLQAAKCRGSSIDQ